MKELEHRKALKAAQRCLHCEELLIDATSETCPRCKKILRKAAGEKGWRWKLTVQILDHYGWRCACCGEREPIFLTLDHKEGGGNEERRKLKGSVHDWYRQVIKDGFPDNLRVLCFNCNLGAARNGGECPHEEQRRKEKISERLVWGE